MKWILMMRKKTNKFLIHKFHLILSRLINYQLEEKQFHSGHKMKLSLSKRIHTCVIHSVRFRANQRKTRPTQERECEYEFVHYSGIGIILPFIFSVLLMASHPMLTLEKSNNQIFPFSSHQYFVCCLVYYALGSSIGIALLLLWVHQTDKTHLKFMCWC